MLRCPKQRVFFVLFWFLLRSGNPSFKLLILSTCYLLLQFQKQRKPWPESLTTILSRSSCYVFQDTQEVQGHCIRGLKVGATWDWQRSPFSHAIMSIFLWQRPLWSAASMAWNLSPSHWGTHDGSLPGKGAHREGSYSSPPLLVSQSSDFMFVPFYPFFPGNWLLRTKPRSVKKKHIQKHTHRKTNPNPPPQRSVCFCVYACVCTCRQLSPFPAGA